MIRFFDTALLIGTGRSTSTEVACFCHVAGDRIAALRLLAAIDFDDHATG